MQPLLKEAIAKHKASNFPEAEKAYLKLLDENPNNYLALRLLGVIKAQLKNYEVAIKLFEKAIKLNPDAIEAYVDLHRTLAKIYERKQNYFNKFVENSLKILEINPSHLEVLTRLAGVYKNDNQFSKAIPLYEKLIDLEPNNLHHVNNYATILANLGRNEEAKKFYKDILKKDPDFFRALYNLLTMFKSDEDFEDLKKQAENLYSKLPVKEKVSLGFALAKIYEEKKAYQKAFDILKKSNDTLKKLYPYNRDQYILFFKNIMEACNQEYFNKKFKNFSFDLTPIFIVGMPRSGTSLLEQILASHQSISAAGELHILARTLASGLDITTTELKNRIQNFDSKFYIKLGQLYIDSVSKFACGKRFLTDKMPSNFSYLGFIKLMIPNAKIVHIKRDPKDTMFSCYKQFFTRGNYYANDLDDLSNYYDLYSMIMDHWNKILPEGFIYELRYENLLENQEKATKDLVAYLGLNWDSACLEFYKNSRVVETASRLQVRQPIHKNSIGTWDKYAKFIDK